MMDYPVVITPLSIEEGGGYVAYAPDLKGCMSDGDTPEETIVNIRDAIEEWLDCARERGMKIPEPGSRSAQFAKEQRIVAEAIKGVISDLEEMRKNYDQIEARLCEVERKVTEVDEKIEESQAWARFGQLVGHSVSEPEVVLIPRTCQ